MYLAHAVDLGDRLMAAFDSPTGIPWSLINLGRQQGIPDRDNNGWASLAEAGTLGLEFKYLSHLTGDLTYWRAVEKVGGQIPIILPARSFRLKTEHTQVSAILKKETTNEGIASIFIS